MKILFMLILQSFNHGSNLLPTHLSEAVSEKDYEVLSGTSIPPKKYYPVVEDIFRHVASPGPGWLPAGFYRNGSDRLYATGIVRNVALHYNVHHLLSLVPDR